MKNLLYKSDLNRNTLEGISLSGLSSAKFRVNTYFSSDEEHHYQGDKEEQLKLHDGRGSKPIQERNVRCTGRSLAVGRHYAENVCEHTNLWVAGGVWHLFLMLSQDYRF